MRRIVSLTSIVFLFCITTILQAQPSHIKFSALPPVSMKAGDTVAVVVKASIDKHWHTYGFTPTVGPDGLGPLATKLSLTPKQSFTLAKKPRFVKGLHKHYDKAWEADVEEIDGKVEIEVHLVASKKLAKGTSKAVLNFYLQMCDTTSCLPAEEFALDVPITITEEYKGADTSEAVVQVDTATTQKTKEQLQPVEDVVAGVNDEIESEKQKGIWSFFLYAMGIGFVALLTPCVFPMIPITVSFFTKRQEKASANGIKDSLLFGAGIVATFTLVGLLASIIFGGASVQNFAASWITNIVIATIFLVLAFNLFGAFEIQVPIGIMNALNKRSQGNGFGAVIGMGITFALTSFTCTVPFVGTLLLSAAKSNELLYPFIGTLGFATAFAIPFVILSVFPKLLVRLPKSGGWMNNLKVVMGFLEVAAAIKFISNADLAGGWGIMPREIFLAIWAGVCLLITLYILGVFAMKLDSTLDRVSAIRAVFAIVFVSLTFWFTSGMLGRGMGSFIEALLPPENYNELIGGAPQAQSAGMSGATTSNTHSAWINNLEEAKKKAKTENKPILIDFTGFTCTNCRLMEKYVFTQPVIAKRFEKFILVQLFTDRPQEPYISNQKILASYGTIANPLYVMLKPDGSYISKIGYQPQFQSNPELFGAFLDKALK